MKFRGKFYFGPESLTIWFIMLHTGTLLAAQQIQCRFTAFLEGKKGHNMRTKELRILSLSPPLKTREGHNWEALLTRGFGECLNILPTLAGGVSGDSGAGGGVGLIIWSLWIAIHYCKDNDASLAGLLYGLNDAQGNGVWQKYSQ